MKKATNKKGFTIVELVIVIAVIAILAAVLIPTFSSVIKKAKKSSAQQKARNALTVVISETTGAEGSVGDGTYFFVVDGYNFKAEIGDGKDAKLVDATAAEVTAATGDASALNANEDISKIGVTVKKAAAAEVTE